MSKVPQVALLLETARGYGRQVAMGVARYAKIHGPWSFLLTPADFEQKYPEQGTWEGDGVIARLSTAGIEQALLEANLPTIALDMEEQQADPANPLSRFSDLSVDSEAASRLAAEHLMERKYPNYAFVGVESRVWSKKREVAFQQYVGKAGFDVHIYHPPEGHLSYGWEKERPQLAQWLADLPKPVGLMTCNDVRGRQVLDACQLADLKVPKDVAVVGVDNDELFCELAHPTLTSVSLNAVAGGYAAAGQLDKMMRGKAVEPARLLVRALRVVTRQSTNSFIIEDRGVLDALEFIHGAKGSNISVPDVVSKSKLSRRELDTRFRKHVGHTVSSEIQRVRLEQAKVLLEETDYPIPDVAEAAGYSSASYMVQVFRQKLGTTPAKYRASLRRFTAQSESPGIVPTPEVASSKEE